MAPPSIAHFSAAMPWRVRLPLFSAVALALLLAAAWLAAMNPAALCR
jgi:hypothetical protein